jgi:hypothetical protein
MGGNGSGRKPYKHLTRVGAPAPVNTPEIALVSDPDGVTAEFEQLAKAAQSENTLDAYRRVHETARVCHANGYAVPFHPLPYLTLLSAAEDAATSKRQRDALRKEVRQVYADMRAWRDG